MSILGKASGILGINARNLLYVGRFNRGQKKRLADDKIYTKHFLQARGIGAAKLYDTIKSINGLRNFNPDALPKSFIIKPNKGFGGEGIIAIKNKRGDIYETPDNTKYRWSDIYEHCISILDGRYAVSGLRDTVIFEELLESDKALLPYAEGGLPDIRIIVFKYVPIIAMLRLPTSESQGKANLHLGAVGCGIDIGTGKTTFGVQHNKLIKRLPNGELVAGIAVPYWDDILLSAAKTQYATQIGYLAVDMAATKTGIKVIELNARAGLAIQISNQSLLRRRLEKLHDVKVVSPAEGVKLGKSLFTRLAKETKVAPAKLPRPTIGLYEYVNVINATNGQRRLAKIDPHSTATYIDPSITLPDQTKLLTLLLKDKKIKLPFEKKALTKGAYQLVIGGRHLTDFLIDASRAKPPELPKTLGTPKEEKIIQNIDAKLARLNEQIHLVARLKPQNMLEAQKVFLKNPNHNPCFEYKKHDMNIHYLKSELQKMPRQVDHALMPLFRNKMEELKKKLSLVEHVGTTAMAADSEQLYGGVQEDQYHAAITFLKQTALQKDTSKVLTIDTVTKRINAYLTQQKLHRWKIKLLETATSGMQINKNNTIFINKKARITEHRLQALIAHEIETHIFRLENGRRQKYKLFEQGTAGYLMAEEGLAIYNQNKLGLPLGEKQFSPALNIIAIYHGKTMSFVKLYHYLVDNFSLTPQRAWRLCVRTKRGLEDTGQPGAFTKDRVYFIGYRLVDQLIKDKGLEAYKKLYVGKIGIPDLIYIADFKSWPLNFLPTGLVGK